VVPVVPVAVQAAVVETAYSARWQQLVEVVVVLQQDRVVGLEVEVLHVRQAITVAAVLQDRGMVEGPDITTLWSGTMQQAAEVALGRQVPADHRVVMVVLAELGWTTAPHSAQLEERADGLVVVAGVVGITTEAPAAVEEEAAAAKAVMVMVEQPILAVVVVELFLQVVAKPEVLAAQVLS
jgi:hypothetical protein